VDVAHEHRDRLVPRERHADLHGDSRVCDVGRRPMPDAVCADVRQPCTLEDAPPALVVGVLRHRPVGIEDGWADVG
jgi:hypothetical protein